MRDGNSLFTVVYAKKDRSRTCPFPLSRTRSSAAPYGVDNYRAALGPPEEFAKAGFFFIYQDMRGRFMSE